MTKEKKEEMKNEMKNRISFALRDPILQQGFEIICKELEQEKKLNAEIKARFVKCNTCTPDMKEKCLMFNENLCEGERCEELVDLMALVSKSDLQKENEELKQQIEKMKCCGNCKYSNQESVYSIVCKVGGVDKSDYINVDDNQVCDKWEIKE
jgi:hypothetical protein